MANGLLGGLVRAPFNETVKNPPNYFSPSR